MEINEMKAYVAEHLAKMNDYSFMEEDFAAVVSKLVETETAYIDGLQPDSDGEYNYDDDEAFELLLGEMQKAFPQYKMYLETLVDDYLDVSEQYLSEHGDIDWD